jgi:hypothetical protein
MALLLKEVLEAERKQLKNVPPLKEHEAKFPKRAHASMTEAKQAFREWQKQQPVPAPKKNPDVRIRAVPPSAGNVAKLAAIAESDAAPQELVRQKLDEEQFFGTLFSSLTTYQYIRMEGEYKKRKAAAKTAGTTDRQWGQVVQGFQNAYAAAGMKVSPEQLAKFAKDLAGNKRHLETVAKMANSAVVKEQAPSGLGATLPKGVAVSGDLGILVGSFEMVTMRVIDTAILTTIIPNLCSQPFAQGTFTKHWSHSWSLTVSIPYPCPTWTNPFRICWHSVTVASVSIDVGLNVGYKVTCCGASAWGQAHAQACGSVAGITKCVGCTATVVGVAGFTRTPVGSQCNYGLGINASLQCQVFGATVFNASWPFGYTITGPCPPPGLC